MKKFLLWSLLVLGAFFLFAFAGMLAETVVKHKPWISQGQKQAEFAKHDFPSEMKQVEFLCITKPTSSDDCVKPIYSGQKINVSFGSIKSAGGMMNGSGSFSQWIPGDFTLSNTDNWGQMIEKKSMISVSVEGTLHIGEIPSEYLHKVLDGFVSVDVVYPVNTDLASFENHSSSFTEHYIFVPVTKEEYDAWYGVYYDSTSDYNAALLSGLIGIVCVTPSIWLLRRMKKKRY